MPKETEIFIFILSMFALIMLLNIEKSCQRIWEKAHKVKHCKYFSTIDGLTMWHQIPSKRQYILLSLDAGEVSLEDFYLILSLLSQKHVGHITSEPWVSFLIFAISFFSL